MNADETTAPRPDEGAVGAAELEDELGRIAGSSQSQPLEEEQKSSKQRKVGFSSAVPLNDSIDVSDAQPRQRCEQVSVQL